MSISREQVADLRPGDVVEIHHPDWPTGTVLRGPLTSNHDGLWLTGWRIQSDRPDGDKRIQWMTKRTAELTVASRAPRPLYVNHPRTEPAPGDVVRTANPARDDDSTTWIYAPENCLDDDGSPWLAVTNKGELMSIRFLLDPGSLRLLVDGETGQVVP